MPEPQPPLAGATLAHYRLANRLGAGGMGEVYAAEDTKLGRRIALKILQPDFAGDPLRLERFRREARAVAALNHPNIITIHSVEEDRGIHFLTMELVEGETLRQRLRRGGLSLAELLELAVPLADAVGAAHERGITHRDLKPENVMVTRDGRVKVLDFGLAQLRERAVAVDSQAVTYLTEAGTVMGTAAYLSPEQAMGREVDARSDIFSLGIVLFEMASGRHPFAGASAAEIISAILRDKPAPVTERNAALPDHLGRIVGRCLEKNPEHRYQSAKDLRNDLRDLGRELDATERLGNRAAAAAPVRRPRWLLPVLPALLALVLGTGWWLLSHRPESARTPPAGPADAPDRAAIAVLHFQNLTGDPKLDWLRTGLTEMLVTDLSQSPGLEVLSTGRLYQILKKHDALDRAPLSFEAMRAVAEEAAVQAMVRGSFARVGERYRLAVTVEEPTDGRIVASERVEGRGPETLFTLVDQLSAAIRRTFEIRARPELPETVAAVTTSSVEAWRNYSEANRLAFESKPREAIGLLEQAVAIDPTFALAYASLGRLYENLGNTPTARHHTRRAIAHAERLPLDQRSEIEGFYYAGRWATKDRAIAAFRQALRLYPKRESLRNNLANLYAERELYQRALDEYRQLIEQRTSYPGTYTAAANAYAALDRFDEGYRLLSGFAGRAPDNWFVQLGLGWHLTEWGKLDRAAAAFDRAAELRPGELFVAYGRWRLAVLREDWPAAARHASVMAAADDPFGRWRGAASEARNLLYQGRSDAALARLDGVVAAYGKPDALSALGRCWKAELLLQRGEPEQALAEAELARREGRDEWPELRGIFFAAQAQQALSRPVEARSLQQLLAERNAANPNPVEERQLHLLAGLLALARGEAATAVEALNRAAALLPPKGVEVHWHVYPDHVPIWTALGEAERAAGRPERALAWFQRAAASGSEHLEQPVPYVRSFYFLGRIREQRGETEEARRSFARFRAFWAAGDLDRDRMAALPAAVRPSP
ncbi:MAG TPA: protein kinase [Thermoanaerobaculia bacterium]|nr:protein kinase [Thermoanaerobaculia bacterium]